MKEEKKVGFLNLLAYGSGDFFGGGSFLIIGMLYMIYLTDVVGLSPFLASLVFLIGKGWDAVSDPLMGFISDHTKSKFGRRRVFFLIGLIPIPLSFMLLWLPISFASNILLFLYYSLAYIIFSTVFTMVMVPYSALNAEMTTDFKKRTRLSGARMIFSQFSALLAGTIPKIIIDRFPDNPVQGYLIMAIVFAVLYTIPWLLVFFGTWELPYKEKVREKGGVIKSVFKNFGTIFINKSFRTHIVMYIMSYSAMDILMALFTYYLTYYIGRTEWYPFAMGSLLITQILMLPVYVMLANKKGKGFAYILGLGIWVIGMVMSFLISADELDINKPLDELSQNNIIEEASDFSITTQRGETISLDNFDDRYIHLNFSKWIHYQEQYITELNNHAKGEAVSIIVINPQLKYYKEFVKTSKKGEERKLLLSEYQEYTVWSRDNKEDANTYSVWSEKFPKLAGDFREWSNDVADNWLEKYDVDYLVNDVTGSLTMKYGIDKFPTNVIIDKERMNIIHKARGGNLLYIIVVCILIGAGLSAGVMIPWAILPSVTDVDELISKKRRAGTYSGAMTLIRKLVQGVIAMPIVGLVLEFIGYSANSLQAKSTLMSFKLFFMLGPIVILVLGIIFATRFKITPGTHKVLKSEIDRLNEGGSKADADPETKKICEKLTGIEYDKLYTE